MPNLFYVYTNDGFWLAGDEKRKTSYLHDAAEFTSADLAKAIGQREFGDGEFYLFGWYQ